MRFKYKRFFWITSYLGPDISLGIHFCIKGRVDIHVLLWMISIGNIPIYENQAGDLVAASNSYHDALDKRKASFRAGVPPHN